MLTASDTPIENAIRAFADYGVTAAYFVPTETALKKSIIDAHEGVRAYLRNNRIHEFAEQAQGQSHKKLVDVAIVGRNACSTTVMSLYRPETKAGDPRFWVRRLPEFVAPWNLVALIADHNHNLFLVNCSDAALMATIADASSPLGRLLRSKPRNAIADELVERLKGIAHRGFIASLRDGPTGIGYTLESLLGIEANTRKTPDYRGIELKSKRWQRGSQLQTLFAKSPDWERSALNAHQMLKAFGYSKDGRLQLYCTVGPSPNTLGLRSTTNDASNTYEVQGKTGDTWESAHLWSTSILETALVRKHRETFWVEALTQRSPSGREEFHYFRAVHTQQPLAGNLTTLLEIGKVTLDYTLSERQNGTVRDHGYLFRMKDADRDLLFPRPVVHDLRAA